MMSSTFCLKHFSNYVGIYVIKFVLTTYWGMELHTMKCGCHRTVYINKNFEFH